MIKLYAIKNKTIKYILRKKELKNFLDFGSVHVDGMDFIWDLELPPSKGAVARE